MNQPDDERDLAHESDIRALMRQQLRDNISPDEAAEEMLGDPDEWDFDCDESYEPQCGCNAVHVPVEIDGGRCWTCGGYI